MKKRNLSGLFTGLILITMLMVSSAWSETVMFMGEPVEIMPLKDVEPGMTGYGLTVFEGTLVEKFGIEIISITNEMKNTHLIWIRPTYSPKDILKRAGIIAGMSGSPTFLLLKDDKTGQEKLAGALAYGWSFQPPNEALAGITPIEEMLRLEELKKIYEQNEALAQEAKKVSAANLSELKNRLMIPIVVSGCDSRIVKFLKEELAKQTGFGQENFNFIELNTGGNACSTNLNTPATANTPPLKNGDAIAGVLSKGDITIAGVGTVTLSNKGGFIAFGHPFFWTGKTNIPVFGAEIAMIVPNMASSFKYEKGITGPQLGTIVVDSLGGILGEWQIENTMLPIKVNLVKFYLGGFKKQEEFNSDIAPKAPISDAVFFSVILNSIFVGAPDLENVNVNLETEFTYIDKDGLKQKLLIPKKFFAKNWLEVYYGLSNLRDQYRIFAESKIKLVNVDVNVKITQRENEIPELSLVRAEAEKPQVNPLEKTKIGLMLTDGKKNYDQSIKIQAPSFNGTIWIRIQDKDKRLNYLISKALNKPEKINKVFSFAKTLSDNKNVLYLEINYVKAIVERNEGIVNNGWNEVIKEKEETINTEIKEIEFPKISGEFNVNIDTGFTISIKEAAKERVEKTEKKTKDSGFKPGLFLNPPTGLFSDFKGNLRINLIGADVGLLQYKRLQIFNFGLGINSDIGNLELYGKFAPLKVNLWKNWYAETNVAVNTKGKLLIGLGFSLKI